MACAAWNHLNFCRVGTTATLLLLVISLAGCQPLRVVERAIKPATPHERYAGSLASAGLADTALARAWLSAAVEAIGQPVSVTLPFAEEAYVDAARPRALGYLLALEPGQRLDVQATFTGASPAVVFLDLFDRAADDASAARPLASADAGSLTLTFETLRAGEYILRVQPELLRGGRVRITSAPSPSLNFPVLGAEGRNLQSEFGMPRDGGRRQHEGVDIFARRGTSVLSATNGRVTSVGQNTLGGNVVWVWDTSRGLTLYYAHLDTQLVTAGQGVSAGDVLGTVGNTGNAKTTAPHLHFGVYAPGQGALDPVGFIRPVSTTAAAITADMTQLGAWARTRASVVARNAPSSSAGTVRRLPRSTPLVAEGALASYVRVRLPDGASAFVAARDLDLSPKPLETIRVRAARPLRAEPRAEAPVIAEVPSNARLAVLGRFAEQWLVENEAGTIGWVEAERR